MAKTNASKKKPAGLSGRSQKRGATKKGKKNSLVGNINKRKKAGTNRSKKNSKVSKGLLRYAAGLAQKEETSPHEKMSEREGGRW